MTGLENLATCPLCNSTDGRKIFSERNHDLIACQECNLHFIFPYPASIDDQHTRVSDYSYDELVVADSARHEAAEIEMTDFYFGRLKPFIEGRGRLLDIGCGTGTLMGLVKGRFGMECEGIELNKERCSVARSKGFVVHREPIERFASTKKFDCITLINVLSHIPDFDRLFLALRSLCAPGGAVIIKTGEVMRNVNGSEMADWGIPDHLHFLGDGTIGKIAGKYGFDILMHDRWPLSEEMFSINRFRAPGRSRLRNALKRIVISVPFSLKLMRHLYNMRKPSGSVYSSLIVLSPANASKNQTVAKAE